VAEAAPAADGSRLAPLLPEILRDAMVAGLIALALAFPIIGLRTAPGPQGLVIVPQWRLVAIMVAVVFVGRIGLQLWWRFKGEGALAFLVPHFAPSFAEGGRPAEFVALLRRSARFLAPAGIGFAVLLPWFPFADRYILDVGILVMTYVMLGWGLNIVVGLAGLLDLGYAAFYAVGAYSYALIAITFGWSFWVCLPLAGLFAAAFGILLGFPVLRLRGDYLAIVTLGFGEIIRAILLNWAHVTGGPNGISGIPRPSFFGLPFDRDPAEGTESFHTFFGLEYSTLHRIVFFYYIILALALVTNLFTRRIRRLPIGRAWEALREDEIGSRALGINPTNTKLTAFAIGAMFAGFAGSFFATRQGFISPESFTFIESAVIVAIVVLGGMGSQVGVVIAALLMIGGTELFREFADFRMLAFGAAMVLIMIWRPRGLLSHREPLVRLDRSGT
jgi:branched-chain amino acid transport system permease protein